MRDHFNTFLLCDCIITVSITHYFTMNLGWKEIKGSTFMWAALQWAVSPGADTNLMFTVYLFITQQSVTNLPSWKKMSLSYSKVMQSQSAFQIYFPPTHAYSAYIQNRISKRKSPPSTRNGAQCSMPSNRYKIRSTSIRAIKLEMIGNVELSSLFGYFLLCW